MQGTGSHPLHLGSSPVLPPLKTFFSHPISSKPRRVTKITPVPDHILPLFAPPPDPSCKRGITTAIFIFLLPHPPFKTGSLLSFYDLGRPPPPHTLASCPFFNWLLAPLRKDLFSPIYSLRARFFGPSTFFLIPIDPNLP